ncbi:MAG: hypothetical protein ACK56F_33115, partial [bacterium]
TLRISRIWQALLLIWVLFLLWKAPEVLFRQSYNHTVDYYSLGVVAYECCFGKVTYFIQNLFK